MSTNIMPPTMGPGRGISFGKSGPITCTNDTGGAVAVGDLVAFDPAGADTATPGNGSRYEMAKTPTTAMLARGLFAVVEDLKGGSGADGSQIAVTFSGRVEVTTNGSVTAGAALTGETGQTRFAPASVGGAKIIGFAEAADVGTVVTVYFDGVNGFGTHNTTS